MSNSINLKEFIERISYNKSQTYTKEEVLQELAKIQLLSIVDTLPTENIPSNKIFLVLNNEEIEGNKYDLFVYVNNKWEQIDSLEFNIEDYPTKNELDYELSLKADINHGHDNVTTSSDGFMSKEDKSKLNGIENQATRNLPSDDNPLMDGTASSGTGKNYSRKDHVHPTDTSRASSTHVHGNISNDGKIGSTANKPLITTTSGSVTTGNFETSTNNIKMDGTVNVGSSNNFARSDHVHPTDTSRASTDTATSSKNGLMSKEDKSKLDGVEDEANNYTHPSYTAKTNGLYKVTVDNTGHISGTNTVSGSDLPSHNHDTGDMKDTSAYGNIGSSANATQKTINNNINTKLGQKANSSDVYTKSQTMTSTEIGQAIADGVSNVEIFEVVTTLPTSNIKGNKFYLVPNGENIDGNVYDVNIYVNNKWETIDKLEFDISNYPTTTQVNSLLEGKVDKTDSRLTDSRTPKSHTHGNITNTGAIGSTSGKIVTTGTNGVLTTSDTITKSQISDFPSTMTPSSHTHGTVQNNGTLNSDTTSTNKVVVTDSSNNIKTISKLPLDKVTHQDISGKASSTHTHGSIANNGTLNSDTTTVGKVVVTDGSNNIKTISKLPSANVTHQDISGKAPNNHKSTATTYGVGDASNYGHVKVDSSMNATSTNPVQNKVVKDYIDEQVGDIVSGDVDLSNTHNHDDRYVGKTDSRLTDARTPKFNQITATASNIQDLNNYKTGGFYYCSSDVNNAPYIIHCPWSNGTATPYTGNKSFFLLVETWGTTSTYVKQTLTYYNSNNTFVRTCSNGTWTNWKEFNTNNNDYLRLATRIVSGESAQIPANSIIGGGTDSKYHIVKSGVVLNPKYPILFNTTAIATNSYNDNVYVSHTGVPLTNNVSGLTVTNQKQVYIEGTSYDGDEFKVSNKVFVSEDNLTTGNYYIYIGVSYSTTNIRFNAFHPIVYKYNPIRGLIPFEHSLERYDGKFISGHANPTKPYLRLFNLKARNGESSSSHIIFEIIGNNNDRLYAKIRVDMRQNNSTTNSSYTVTPLEVYGFNLNELYFGFRNAYPNTSLDIFRKVGAYTNFYIRYADDHTRDGTVTMYSPVVNSTESYTDLNEASTALYNASYTATSQGGTYDEVTNTIPYTNVNANKFVKRGGTSSQFLKADGSVDSNTYLTTSSASSTYQPKGNYLTSHNPIDTALNSTSTNAVQNKVINTALGNKVDKAQGSGNANKTLSTDANGNVVLETKNNHTHNYIANSTGSVTSTHIADKTIVNGDIADTTIETGKIKDSAITSAKIADGTIVNGDIANTTITGGKLVNGTITANQLADKSVTDVKLANYEYINGTQTASTSAWTGVTTKLTSTTIPTGTIIYYRLNQSSTSTNATLELKLSSDNTKTTGAKAVYLDDRRVTTHFRLGSIIPLRYDGTNWIVISPYTDNNTTYSGATGTSALGLVKISDNYTSSAGAASASVAASSKAVNDAYTTLNNGKINTSAIKNDLTTGGATNVLSAEQGKNLQNNKVDKAQGSGNANKTLSTDASGNVIVEAKNNHTHSYISTANGSVGTNNLANYAVDFTKTQEFSADGGASTAGYVKVMQITIGGAWKDMPIIFEIFSRSKGVSYVTLMFKNDSGNDPLVNVFTYTGVENEIYIVKNTTSKWDIVVKKPANDKIVIKNLQQPHSYVLGGVTFAQLNTLLTSAPTLGTNDKQATFVGFTSAEKTKLNGITTSADAVSYSQTTSSSSNTYEIGKITINGTSTTLYGKDTVYTAPSAYLTSSVKEASALGKLGTSANATQATINSAINTKIGNLIDSTSTTKNGHTHSYLPLSGGTLTGAVSSNSNITTSGTIQGTTIKKTNGTNSQLLLADGSIKSTGDFATSGHTHTFTEITKSGEEYCRVWVDTSLRRVRVTASRYITVASDNVGTFINFSSKVLVDDAYLPPGAVYAQTNWTGVIVGVSLEDGVKGRLRVRADHTISTASLTEAYLEWTY